MDFDQATLPMFCGNATEIEQALHTKYEERVVLSMRTEGSDNLKDIEIWYNPEKGAASVTIRPQPDVICLVLSGKTKAALKGQPL